MYAARDAEFYPDGIHGCFAKVDVNPEGGVTVDLDLFVEFDDGERPQKIRPERGDSSSDPYCPAS